ncbi:MAG TPA: universal stress protein [Microbacteriaceae bacterium]|nr:universal stress protein [Microbacteriaceae bacterium]
MEGDNTTRRVVVGTDGSGHSRQALRWAARIAAAANTQLDVVMAWVPASLAVPTLGADLSGAGPVHPLADRDKEEVARDLAASVEKAFGPDKPKGMRLLVVEGLPDAVLVKASQQALMLVVGSRGRGGLTGLLLGSVSQKVSARASCPVLVVHDGDDPDAPGVSEPNGSAAEPTPDAP